DSRKRNTAPVGSGGKGWRGRSGEYRLQGLQSPACLRTFVEASGPAHGQLRWRRLAGLALPEARSSPPALGRSRRPNHWTGSPGYRRFGVETAGRGENAGQAWDEQSEAQKEIVP